MTSTSSVSKVKGFEAYQTDASIPERELSATDRKAASTAKITFEKIILNKEDMAPRELRGAVAITCDKKHTGFLHILIYIGQLVNAIFTGKDLKNIDLCHGEVILGVNRNPGKENQLILAHGLFDGIKTTSEDYTTDKIITSVHIYRPVDEKLRTLYAKFAEQTAVNFKKEGIDPKSEDYQDRLKKNVGPFSISDLLLSFFHDQKLKPEKEQQQSAAFAAADLLKGDKFRDSEGNLASYYCTSYMLTLMQGTSLISALSEQEMHDLAVLSRDEIADRIARRIEAKQTGDQLAATYWENEFMRANARFTMTYFAGDLLDGASVPQTLNG